MKQAIKRTLIRSSMYVLKARMNLIRTPKIKEPVDYSRFIYQSIDQLPFSQFMEFYLDGSYWALLKPDAPKQDVDMLQLVKAGQKITEQYIMAMGDNNQGAVDLIISVSRLESRISRLYYVVESLKLLYNQELADTLKSCGYKKPITEDTNLDEVQEYIKYLNAELSQKKGELDKLSGKAGKATREHFESVLIQIDPTIDTTKITTLRYCMIYKQLKARIKAIEDGKRKGK